MNPSGLCKCGCGKKTRIAEVNSTRSGWVKGQPLDYVPGHSRYAGSVGMRRNPNRFEIVDGGKFAICWLRTKKGEIASFVDVDDVKMLSAYTWGLSVGRNTSYASFQTNRRGVRTIISMHRVLLGLQPSDLRVVDHKNHDGLDNRRINLRIVDRSANAYNTEHPSITGLKGVTIVRGRSKGFRAHVQHLGKKMTLGNFFTAEEAYAVALAYRVKHRLIPTDV